MIRLKSDTRYNALTGEMTESRSRVYDDIALLGLASAMRTMTEWDPVGAATAADALDALRVERTALTSRIEQLHAAMTEAVPRPIVATWSWAMPPQADTDGSAHP